jgi:hypothetical protein
MNNDILSTVIFLANSVCALIFIRFCRKKKETLGLTIEIMEDKENGKPIHTILIKKDMIGRVIIPINSIKLSFDDIKPNRPYLIKTKYGYFAGACCFYDYSNGTDIGFHCRDTKNSSMIGKFKLEDLESIQELN